jgi:hypothetical protein
MVRTDALTDFERRDARKWHISVVRLRRTRSSAWSMDTSEVAAISDQIYCLLYHRATHPVTVL